LPPQELEAAANQTGEWAVLQRGSASLPSLYETYYKEQGDAEQYARMLVQLFRSFAEKRARSALGLNDATAEEFFTRTGPGPLAHYRLPNSSQPCMRS
jgi:hypothetical protein